VEEASTRFRSFSKNDYTDVSATIRTRFRGASGVLKCRVLAAVSSVSVRQTRTLSNPRGARPDDGNRVDNDRVWSSFMRKHERTSAACRGRISVRRRPVTLSKHQLRTGERVSERWSFNVWPGFGSISQRVLYLVCESTLPHGCAHTHGRKYPLVWVPHSNTVEMR